MGVGKLRLKLQDMVYFARFSISQFKELNKETFVPILLQDLTMYSDRLKAHLNGMIDIATQSRSRKENLGTLKMASHSMVLGFLVY